MEKGLVDDDENQFGLGIVGACALVGAAVGGAMALAKSLLNKQPQVENPTLPETLPLLRYDRTLGTPYVVLYENRHVMPEKILALGWCLEKVLDTFYKSSQCTTVTLVYDGMMEKHFADARYYLGLIQVEVITRFKADPAHNKPFEEIVRSIDVHKFRSHPMMTCLLSIRTIRTNTGQYRQWCCHHVTDNLGRTKMDLAVPVVHQQGMPYTFAEPSVKRETRERSYVIKNRRKQQIDNDQGQPHQPEEDENVNAPQGDE